MGERMEEFEGFGRVPKSSNSSKSSASFLVFFRLWGGGKKAESEGRKSEGGAAGTE